MWEGSGWGFLRRVSVWTGDGGKRKVDRIGVRATEWRYHLTPTVVRRTDTSEVPPGAVGLAHVRAAIKGV